MNIIFTIGIFLSFFQFVLLQNKKHKTLPDKLLAFWMFIIGIHLTSYYLYYLGYWDKYPHLVGITVPFPLFYGPLLYLYTFSSLRNFKSLLKKDYLHFLPVVLSFLYMFKFYFFYSIEEKRMVDKGEVDDFSIFSVVLLIAFMVSGTVYSILSYRLVNNHKKIINDNFSNDENINLDWLKYFIWSIGFIFLVVIVIIISRDFIGIEYDFNADLIFYSLLVVAILVLGYFGIKHQNIFTDKIIINDVAPSKSRGEYKKSGLKDEIAKEIHSDLLKIMNEQKPYLEPKLTLNELSKSLNVSINNLSQTINQYENQNFNDFINKYRIEEFIRRATENQNFSILANAYDSGFNSKSTFNNVFKKHKGITPSSYLSKYLGNL